jgi:hypothetical protein
LLAGSSSPEAIAFLLSSYFDSREGKRVFPLLKQQSIEKKWFSVLENIRKLHAKTPGHEKRRWLSLLTSCMTLPELLEAGFRVDSKSFATARKFAQEVGPGEPVPPSQQAPSKKELPDTVREKIVEFFLSDSVTRPSPNRTVKVNKQLVPVRLLQMTVSKAFSLWNETPGNPRVSEASFRKYMPPQVKKPRQETDLCEVCVAGRKAEKKLARHQRMDLELSQEKLQKLKTQVELYKEHYQLKEKRREEFKKQVSLFFLTLFF